MELTMKWMEGLKLMTRERLDKAREFHELGYNL